ncbi:polyphosphate polymerase domain-containing protein [Candidatus Saccharibacteria bacterium]|nr:polyphosphate polymerase domain-containing protein [Candidatus Saccharibacteria bacterium]
MDEQKFNRVEKKYLLTKQQYKRVLSIVRAHMEKDEYFRSSVYNLYFDTDNYDLIVQSIDRPLFKKKFRARGYGGYDKVFLEIKTKLLKEISEMEDSNLGYKRRILLSHRDFDTFLSDGEAYKIIAGKENPSQVDLQIAREVDYFKNHFNLKPKIMVRYKRESYAGVNGLRITFDKDLKYRTSHLSLNDRQEDKNYFKNGKNIIMEVKTHVAMPMWLVYILSKEQIYPERFSKIGKIYEQIRKEKNV